MAVLYTVNAGLNFGSRWDRNKIGAIAGATTGAAIPDLDASGFIDEDERLGGYVENARRAFGEVRYDRFVSDKDSVYALVGAFHDIFAGFDLRSHEQIGYSRLLIANDKTELRGEVGADWAQEWRTTDEYANIIAGRLAAAVTHQFNENVGISDSFELYENILDTADLRILNTAAFNLDPKLEPLAEALAHPHLRQPCPSKASRSSTRRWASTWWRRSCKLGDARAWMLPSSLPEEGAACVCPR